jgi:hypothetical protein
MSFIIDNQEIFQITLFIHGINSWNTHHLHGPNAKLSGFQIRYSYAGIKIFSSLPPSVTVLKNDKAQFQASLRKCLLTHCFYCVVEFCMSKGDS